MTKNSYEKFETAAYQSWWDDGLLDVFAGCALGVIGLSWIMDWVLAGAVFPALLVTLWKPIRQKLIEPRLGYVEFSGKRQNSIRHFHYSLLAAGIAVFALGVVVYFSIQDDIRGPISWIAGLPAILIALPSLAFAFHARAFRYVGYGLVLLALGLATAIRDWEPGPAMLAAGVLVFISGSVLLLKFIGRHPVVRESADEAIE